MAKRHSGVLRPFIAAGGPMSDASTVIPPNRIEETLLFTRSRAVALLVVVASAAEDDDRFVGSPGGPPEMV